MEENHLFFVCHPYTNWYPAFHRLIRENPLPPTSGAKSDDLDRLCQRMRGIRKAMVETAKVERM